MHISYHNGQKEKKKNLVSNIIMLYCALFYLSYEMWWKCLLYATFEDFPHKRICMENEGYTARLIRIRVKAMIWMRRADVRQEIV